MDISRENKGRNRTFFGVRTYIVGYNSEKWIVWRKFPTIVSRAFTLYARSIAYRQRYLALLPYVIETSFTYVCMAAESRVYTHDRYKCAYRRGVRTRRGKGKRGSYFRNKATIAWPAIREVQGCANTLAWIYERVTRVVRVYQFVYPERQSRCSVRSPGMHAQIKFCVRDRR